MPVSLQKGGNISLTKEAPGLSAITIGLGWDKRVTDGQDFDLDACAFVLNAAGQVRSDADFIFYNNRKSADGTIEHTGDNTTGAGAGDDESIQMDLAQTAADVAKVVVAVTVHEAESRRQNFGMVNNAFIRVLNRASGQEIARFDLTEDMSTETSMVFGEVYRHGSDWKFRAVGQGFAGGLGPLARSFGVTV